MSEFSFKETEQKILANFATINSNIVVQPTKFSIVNGASASLIAYYVLEQPYEFEPFGIYDLGNFLRVVDSMDPCVLELLGNYISIRNKAETSEVKYNLTDTDTLPTVKEVGTGFAKQPITLKFSFSADRIAALKRMDNILKFERYYFENRGGTLRVTGTDGTLTEATNPWNIDIPKSDIEVNNLDGELYIRKNDFKLFDGSYDVTFCVRDANETSAGFVISGWENTLVTRLSYYIGGNKDDITDLV